MQVLKFAGFVRVATGSILVYAYILIYCFKELGFENEGFGKSGKRTALRGQGKKKKYNAQDTQVLIVSLFIHFEKVSHSVRLAASSCLPLAVRW